MLDETSRAIGKLEAQADATAKDVAELKEQSQSMNEKLDRLLARSKNPWTVKQWLTVLAASSAGGGGIAHVLRKLLEP